MLASAMLAASMISIHALREEGDNGFRKVLYWSKISIHALREEGDESTDEVEVTDDISIHALREEGDLQYAAPFGMDP